MNADDLSALNDQIAAMARAGLPLDQGLDSLAREMGRGRLRSTTEELAVDLRAGHPLPEALARQEGRIPPYYASLVTAGIQTGRLPEVLTTLTTYARTVATTRTTVVEAMFYPAVFLVIGIALFGGLALFVLPEFDSMFQNFGLKLPWITELMLSIGRHPIEFVVIPAAVLFVGLMVFWILARYTAGGRRAWGRAVYFIPLVGKLIRSARLATFTDLLAILVEHGVPLPTAFRLAGEASSDPDVAVRAREVEERLKRGVPLAEGFRGLGLVPQWAAWLASAGEGRGALAPALREIAVIYQRQVNHRSAILRSVMPPLVVILTAGILSGCFIMSLMLPMLKLLEGLSK